MSTFVVLESNGAVVLETDDWRAAERAALVKNWPNEKAPRRVTGTHPTHVWDTQRPRRCTVCGAWDNGSYGSHAPCGFDWSHNSLAAELERG